jgi:hypothetical protein
MERERKDGYGFKRPSYRVHAIFGTKRYRIGSNSKPVMYGYPIYAWLKLMPDAKRFKGNAYDAVKMIQRVFGNENSSKCGLYACLDKGQKTCLYVGQSVQMEERLRDHLEKIELAGMKLDLDPPLPEMYRYLNGLGKIFELEWISLPLGKNVVASTFEWDERVKRKSGHTLLEVLAVLEQWLMDMAKPEINVAAARKTVFHDDT